jgi:hypothetical protein
MVASETGEPVGERVRALEVGQESLAQRVEHVIGKLDAIEKAQLEIKMALERRTMALRITGWVVDFFKLLTVAVVSVEFDRFVRLVRG